MHNFIVPSVFKLWIDQIACTGERFTYVDGAPVGLLKNKKATFMTASGGVYDAGTAMASFNFVEPYLRTIFGLSASPAPASFPLTALRFGQVDRQSFLQPHIASIRAQFQAVSLTVH
jgi:FMN-dependent NADH-azoreductase